MTQIANVLAVATVFIGLWTPTSISTFDSQRRGGLIGETKIPMHYMQELEPKVQGA